ncbi:molybdate ABC transporter substrate-binding protein [Roseobacter cerasinus]|uniref:Molybdate ABC transporter substrate-binding protein n=1 Tax=Roseobacter cerasinus TaxID=2602289 RepID=A0A640VT11_9RHOB|nr:molybdate ABC transporter substrate-binding protein [Roseobacter cerasinus]GFE50035.1 molybdate ABC transporter substrate-binding protein [Roseobacter cerasinus]
MGKSVRFWGWATALVLSLSGPAMAERITVFAAASLKTALDQIADSYALTSGDEVVISYAGTPVLARQISLGAPADIVVTASTEWMDWLEARGAIAPESRFDLAGNRLVLIAHDSSHPAVAPEHAALDKALGEARVAMALVEAVPAGIYGKAALLHLGLWERLSPQVVQTDNVRAALALVATGATAFGVVYDSDARAEPRVSLVTTFPSESHPAITYPAARVDSRDTPAAQRFFAHLRSPEARAQLRDMGFTAPPGAP